MKRAGLAGVMIVATIALCTAAALAAPMKRRVEGPRIRETAERPLILGGLPAAPGTFGMMAFVAYEDPDSGDLTICSGTVVAPQLVLTAGHCALDTETGTMDQPRGYVVVTGSLDWTSPARRVSAVTRTILNPGYNSVSGDADAALLVLGTPTTAPAVPLANASVDLELLKAGAAAQIAGWGLTSANTVPDQLQWGLSFVQSSEYCAQQAAYIEALFDAGRQMCAVDTPTFADGTCFGDSGGPLLGQRADGTWVELGITAFGAGDCDTGVPDFFTRADAVSGWVARWIQALDGPRPPSAPVGIPPPPGTPPPASAPPRSAPPPHVSPKPLAGVYQGRTSQHWPITLQIAPSRTAVSSLSFSFTLSCARHRRVSYRIAPGGGHITWRLRQSHGLGFDDTFSDATGEHYEVNGNFDSSGSAAGFITTTWRSRRFRTCRSGLVRWGAHNT
jgi:Trypsin